jgi:hypothetical protein
VIELTRVSESDVDRSASERRVYQAFGMTIAARLPLPELLEGAGEPEVEVVSGSVPSDLPDAVRRGLHLFALGIADADRQGETR